MLSKNWLLITCLTFAFGLTFNVSFACDTTPVITPSNVQSVGGGNYSMDVQVCVGVDGSIDGFATSINCGLNIVSVSPTSLVSGGSTANAFIAGNTVTYNCATCSQSPASNWWAVDDNIAGPCFNFTMIVTGDPSGCAITTTGVNDGCLIIQTSWTVPIPGPCITAGSINAPGSFSGNTSGAGSTCVLRASTDQVVAINLPCNDNWTFSLCGGSSWDTYLYVGSGCCAGNIGINDDFCGLQSQVTANVGPGTVFATVEAFSTFGSGTYTLNVTGANGCPLDLSDIEVVAIPNQEENIIDVSWEVEDEINVASYFLERSIDDGPFTTLETLEPRGINPSGKTSYAVRDWRVKENELYQYRVHVHTTAGEMYDTEIVSAMLMGSEGLNGSRFYPNPASGEARIDLQSGQEGMVIAQVYDTRGRVISEQQMSVHAGTSTARLNLENLTAGVYFVRMSDSQNHSLMRKLVVE